MANSPPTLNRRLSNMSAIMHLCFGIGYLIRSVAILIKALKH